MNNLDINIVMIFIKCNNRSWAAHVCNARTAAIEEWLEENVGYRWKDWDWGEEFGVIIMPDNELATAFTLRFGI